MKKSLVILFSSLALILCPLLVLAAMHNTGAAKEPAASAYEHADDKAKFQRDSHDMGEHQGEAAGQDKDADKDKDKDKSEGAGDDGKDKAKSKQKSKSDHDDHQHDKNDKK
jgi:Skp family chaperone for outer membrane proteins